MKTLSLCSIASLAVTCLLPVHAEACKTCQIPHHKEAKKGGTSNSALKTMEVCFVLDTTGSMGGLIDGAKKKIWSIANQIVQSKAKPETIRFGLIGYRDRGDTYVTKIHGLTDDLDSIYLNLSKFRAEGGGDHPESVNQALHEAVENMQWTSGEKTKRIIFLVGDAPPKMGYSDDVKFYESCARAVEKKIRVNTLQCGTHSETTNIWSSISNLGKGKFAMIPQDGGTKQIASQYDDEFGQLEVQINGTVMLYGDASARARDASKLEALNRASRTEKASRATYARNAGKSKAIDGTRNDLVDMWANKEISIDEVIPGNLPKPYQALSKGKLKQKLDSLVEKRQRLQKRQLSLVDKREAEIHQKRKNQPKDAFDVKVQEMLATD